MARAHAAHVARPKRPKVTKPHPTHHVKQARKGTVYRSKGTKVVKPTTTVR